MGLYFFLTPSGIQRVNAMFSLPSSGKEQDWEVEMAAPERRNEFLHVLTGRSLSGDEGAEAALAALYIASADEALDAGVFNREEDEAAFKFFRDNPQLREKMRRLWFQHGAPNNAGRIGAWLQTSDPQSHDP